MRRFEVWRLVPKDKHGGYRLVMILQSEKVNHLTTIIVAPLKLSSLDMIIPDLTPKIEINGNSFAILVPLMMSIDRKLLDICVHNGEAHNYEISKAIDRVFIGV